MTMWRNMVVASTAMLIVGTTPLAAQAMKPTGTVAIDETQFGFLIGGSTGGGTLTFEGKTYPFKINGISVGDIGVSKVRGDGIVYDMTNIAQFAGDYTKLDASATAGKGAGSIRLRNKEGVTLDISTKSGGLQLSAGAGGVRISMR